MRIGPGLMQNKDIIYATKAGYLKYSPQHKFYWLENNQKRVCTSRCLFICVCLILLQYVPATEDMVIGIVLDKYL